ncbi:MAG: arsenate reductase ArsC [Euryarchaeota archaeon]|nr:arsenate reductase ArsC [Euryarchaeota archaeon]
MKKRVLFVCTHNAGRSQMAEAILNSRYGDRYEAFSAGIHPSGEIHPDTIAVLKEVGIEISEKAPKPLLEYMDQSFDLVVQLSDCTDTGCTLLPASDRVLNKTFPDPYGSRGSDNEILAGFRNVRDEISAWIDEEFGQE